MTKGTKEWAKSNVNFQSGCSEGCEYCYSRLMANKFGWKLWDDWTNPRIRFKDINRRYKKRNGRVMFPSSHNIDPCNYIHAVNTIHRLADAGNEILVVMKPRAEVIKEMCMCLGNNLKFVEFRFTITTLSSDLQQVFEPNAPSINTRFIAIQEALLYISPNRLSVSIEPFLDRNPLDLINELMVYGVYDNKIWLGPMNHISQLCKLSPVVKRLIGYLRDIYDYRNLQHIYDRIKDLQLNIQFKDGFLNQMNRKR